MKDGLLFVKSRSTHSCNEQSRETLTDHKSVRRYKAGMVKYDV